MWQRTRRTDRSCHTFESLHFPAFTAKFVFAFRQRFTHIYTHTYTNTSRNQTSSSNLHTAFTRVSAVSSSRCSRKNTTHFSHCRNREKRKEHAKERYSRWFTDLLIAFIGISTLLADQCQEGTRLSVASIFSARASIHAVRMPFHLSLTFRYPPGAPDTKFFSKKRRSFFFFFFFHESHIDRASLEIKIYPSPRQRYEKKSKQRKDKDNEMQIENKRRKSKKKK